MSVSVTAVGEEQIAVYGKNAIHKVSAGEPRLTCRSVATFGTLLVIATLSKVLHVFLLDQVVRLFLYYHRARVGLLHLSCSSSRKLLLFVHCSNCYCFRARPVIVSVVFRIVPLNGNELFM